MFFLDSFKEGLLCIINITSTIKHNSRDDIKGYWVIFQSLKFGRLWIQAANASRLLVKRIKKVVNTLQKPTKQFHFAFKNRSDRCRIWNDIRAKSRGNFHFQNHKWVSSNVLSTTTKKAGTSFSFLHTVSRLNDRVTGLENRATGLENRATRLGAILHRQPVYARRTCTIARRACTRRPTARPNKATRAIVARRVFPAECCANLEDLRCYSSSPQGLFIKFGGISTRFSPSVSKNC